MIPKRWRTPKAKLGQLKCQYGKEEYSSDTDLLYCWGGGGAECSDGRILSHFFEEAKHEYGDHLTLKEELIRRGYDITTLKFTIEQLKPNPTPSQTNTE